MTTKSRMAMRTPQPSANLFIRIMDNCERSLFQGRSDLRSNHLPLIALFRKCVGPDEFSVEDILRSLVRFDDALANHDFLWRRKTHLQVVNLGFGENVRMISHDAVIVCQTNEQV